MLIYMQKPDATLVAGYNKWKDQFERHVQKGEHGITIIAPTPYKNCLLYTSLFDLSPKEAAEKLAQDFGLIYKPYPFVLHS